MYKWVQGPYSALLSARDSIYIYDARPARPPAPSGVLSARRQRAPGLLTQPGQAALTAEPGRLH
jgi:hypothetical protein